MDFTKRAHVIINIGQPGTGKTFLTKWLLLRNILPPVSHYKYGVIVTKTKFDAKDYDYIDKKYILGEYDEEVIKDYVNQIVKQVEKKGSVDPSFMVLDDILGDYKILMSPFFKWITSIVRHINMTIIINGQYLFQSVNSVIRECSTIVFMFRSTNNKTIKGLYENFGQLFDDQKEFKKHFLEATKEKHTCMVYTADEDDILKNYLTFKAPDSLKHLKMKPIEFK